MINCEQYVAVQLRPSLETPNLDSICISATFAKLGTEVGESISKYLDYNILRHPAFRRANSNAVKRHSPFVWCSRLQLQDYRRFGDCLLTVFRELSKRILAHVRRLNSEKKRTRRTIGTCSQPRPPTHYSCRLNEKTESLRSPTDLSPWIPLEIAALCFEPRHFKPISVSKFTREKCQQRRVNTFTYF